jgi:hypothetical protein
MCAYADHLRNEPYVLAVQRGISVDQPWPSKTTLQPVDRDQQLLPIQSFDQTIYRNFWTRGSDFKISVDNFLYFNNGVEQREFPQRCCTILPSGPARDRAGGAPFI